MTYIPESLRQQIRERAQGNCEYCLLNERYPTTILLRSTPLSMLWFAARQFSLLNAEY